jgi:hypothetical protein
MVVDTISTNDRVAPKSLYERHRAGSCLEYGFGPADHRVVAREESVWIYLSIGKATRQDNGKAGVLTRAASFIHQTRLSPFMRAVGLWPRRRQQSMPLRGR